MCGAVLAFLAFFILVSACIALQKQVTELEAKLDEQKNVLNLQIAYLESRIDKEIAKK